MDAGTLDSIPQISDAPQIFPQGKFWLVNTEEGLSAVHSSCTHLECLFNWNNQEGEFICPCHGSRFNKSGKVINGPATRDLDRFPVQVVDGEGNILRQTNAETGAPLAIDDLIAQLKEQQQAEQQGNEQDQSAPTKKVILLRVNTGNKIKAPAAS